MWTAIKRLLASRKVQVGVTAAVVAITAELGFNVNESTVLAILGVAGTIIAGIAYEDGKEKGAGTGAK